MTRLSPVALAAALVMAQAACTTPAPRPDPPHIARPFHALASDQPPRGGLFRTWRASVRAAPESEILLDDDYIVVASALGLAAYDARTGRRRWRSTEETGQRYALTAGVVATFRERNVLSGLDASTGEVRWEHKILVPGAGRAGLVTGPDTFVTEDKTGGRNRLVAIDARTGKTRTTVSSPGDSELRLVTGSATANLVLTEDGDRDMISALDPATLKPLWRRRSVAGYRAETARGGLTLLSSELSPWSVVVDRKGEEIFSAEREHDGIEVIGDHIVLDVKEDQGEGLKTAYTVIPAGGGAARTVWFEGEHSSAVSSGNGLFLVRPSLIDNPGATDVPHINGLDVIPGDSLKVRRMPLPVELPAEEHGEPDDVVRVAASQDRLYVLSRAARGLALSAYAADRDGAGPLELGGVPAADWPDACDLIDADPDADGTPVEVTESVRLPNVRCERTGRAGRIDIEWVARTRRAADALLTGTGHEPIRGTGDEAYDMTLEPGSPRRTMLRVGRYIVTVSESEEDEQEEHDGRPLAGDVADRLRELP